MKLSDAMLEGCEIRPFQCQGTFFLERSGLQMSCALGAAFEGVYGPVNSDDGSPEKQLAISKKLGELFPHLNVANYLGELPGELLEWIQENEDQCVDTDTLHDVIALLNDEVRWTRQMIAGWLSAQGY